MHQNGLLSHLQDLDAPLRVAAQRKLNSYRQQSEHFFSSPTVTGCRLGGFPVGRDRWGGERVVGGVLPRIGIGTWGLCARLCLVLVCRGRYSLGEGFSHFFIPLVLGPLNSLVW